MLSALAVYNYRSLRDLVLPLARLNVVTGPNGSGKSNLYRALKLLADIAQGRAVPSLAREGGLQSTLWAGPEGFSCAVRRGEHAVHGTTRKEPVSLRLGFSGEEYGYAIDLGLPTPSSSAFGHDPQIKRECVWNGPVLRPSALLVLNEPETSLHPDLLPALGRLIARAAQRAQVIVVSHGSRLIASLEDERDCHSVVLEKTLAETRLAASEEVPRWVWPSRGPKG